MLPEPTMTPRWHYRVHLLCHQQRVSGSGSCLSSRVGLVSYLSQRHRRRKVWIPFPKIITSLTINIISMRNVLVYKITDSRKCCDVKTFSEQWLDIVSGSLPWHQMVKAWWFLFLQESLDLWINKTRASELKF